MFHLMTFLSAVMAVGLLSGIGVDCAPASNYYDAEDSLISKIRTKREILNHCGLLKDLMTKMFVLNDFNDDSFVDFDEWHAEPTTEMQELLQSAFPDINEDNVDKEEDDIEKWAFELADKHCVGGVCEGVNGTVVGDNKLDLTEYLAAVDYDIDLQDFTKIDLNKDRFIDQDEFNTAQGDVPHDIELLSESNPDGKLSFDEWEIVLAATVAPDIC